MNKITIREVIQNVSSAFKEIEKKIEHLLKFNCDLQLSLKKIGGQALDLREP